MEKPIDKYPMGVYNAHDQKYPMGVYDRKRGSEYGRDDRSERLLVPEKNPG